MIQDIPNGGTHGNYGFSIQPDVSESYSKVYQDIWANFARESQDILILIALALYREFRSIWAIESDN